MYSELVGAYGAWRVHFAGIDVLGFPPSWGTTRKQMGDIATAMESENEQLLKLFD